MKWSNVKALAKVAKTQIVKHSPEILMGLGAASFVTTIIFAAKETVKEQEVLEEHNEEMEYLEDCYNCGELDDKAYKKSKMNTYKHTLIVTSKNYPPPRTSSQSTPSASMCALCRTCSASASTICSTASPARTCRCG